ncbi:hypothetical protein DV737_g1700, partial [Chaetothyriales sp. CBS 132003]
MALKHYLTPTRMRQIAESEASKANKASKAGKATNRRRASLNIQGQRSESLNHLSFALVRFWSQPISPTAILFRLRTDGPPHPLTAMNPWLQDPSANPNSDAGFGATLDPSMSFIQPPQSINLAHFQNPPPYLNGDGRTASPAAFHNPVYQTNQVIPSKRPREDSLVPSPRQAADGLPGSRSQTPQGHFPAFNQANGAGPVPSAPTPFQHLHNSNNASPSPSVPQMNFSQPQRVSTTSPNPFSPQQGNPHASPGPSDNASRVGTPHDHTQGFMPNPSFGAGFNQPQFNPAMANGMGQMGMTPQMNMAQPGMGIKNHEELVKGLQAFMAAKGRSVERNPIICGRPVPLVQIYAFVMRNGGSQRINKMNQWGGIAQQLGFPQPQLPQAAQDLQSFYMANLAPYEAAWQMTQQKQRMAQAAMQSHMQNQISPTREVHQSQDHVQPGHHQRSQSDLMSLKMASQSDLMNLKMASQLRNGFVPQGPPGRPQVPQHHRSSLSRQFEAGQLPGSSPRANDVVKREPEPERDCQVKKPIEDPFKPDVLQPSRLHGPVNVDEINILGQQITDLKPTVPTIRELGVIDIHALTLAIKSGMHAETRVALDTLVTLSTESQLQLSLTECDDLMDTLVDCAQAQVDFLAEHASEVSDEMSLTAYEDLVRACRIEAEALQDIPEFGTLDYDLDRAACRLICVTTLIRNFSFYEANFVVLGRPEVVKMLSNVVRYLGTKEMILRNNRNTLDFMKDVIIYLSNLSTTLNLPGKQEALCLLHFLLAFAPAPPPTSGGSDKVSFTMYSPSIHKYMPPAVDTLAKLLARDDPNRSFYKSIFSADASSTPPYELLTRTFGLAIAPVPQTKALVEARKPFLLQGMLAAEILTAMVPSSDHPLARSWLESEDGFATSLLRLVFTLSGDKSMLAQAAAAPPPRHPGQHPQHRAILPEPDANAYGAITTRALAVLKTLVQKGRVLDADGKVLLPAGIMPRKETVLGALVDEDIDPTILRSLCVYHEFED